MCRCVSIGLLLAPIGALALNGNTGASGSLTQAKTGGSGESGTYAVGSVNVAPDLFTGILAHGIPISVVPGRHSLEPSVQLQYRSANRNGPLGVGWELNLGAIERRSKAGVDFGADDYVLRDAGSAVDLVNVGGGQYQAKYESAFRRIRKLSATDGRPYWEVTTKDGTRYLYGQTAPTRQDDPGQPNSIFRWCVDYVQDTNGNYIQYSYTKDLGEIYPAEIDYTGHTSGLKATNAVIFSWTGATRGDVPLQYGTSFSTPVQTRFLLDHVDVTAGGLLVRRTQLSYNSSAFTGRSVLAAVTPVGKDGTSTLPATSFDQTGASGFSATQLSGLYGNWAGSGDRIRPGDVDGDGFEDLILGPDGSGAWFVMRGSPSGLVDAGQWASNAMGGWASCSNGCQSMIFSGDFNGDGKADVVLGPNPTTSEWVVMTSTGKQSTGFTAPSTWVTWNNGGWFGHPSRVRILDIDGDGKSDILIGPNSNGAFHLLRSTGSGFAVCENFINTGLGGWDNDSAPNLVNVVDVTGDALPDLVLGPNSAGQFWVYKNMGGTATSATSCQGLNGFAATSTLVTGYGKWGSSSAQSMLVRTMDVNGDGRMDIVIGPDDSSATPGYFYVLLSRGDGTLDDRGAWFKASTYSAWSGSANRIRSLDMNGDGMADLLFGPDGSGNWFLLQSSGASFIDKGTIISGVAPAPWDQSVNQNRIRGFDVNGDGLQDIIIGPDSSGRWYQLFGGSPTTSSSTSPDLLAGLHNGYGSSTSVTYTPSTHYNNTYLPFALQVVSQVSINDGNGNTANTQYSYSGGYFHLPERDFRGFALTNVTGPAWPSGARTQTSAYFHQGNDVAVGSNSPGDPVGHMKGKPWRVIAGDSVSSAYRVTDTSYTAYLGGPVYFDAPTDVLSTYCSSSGSCGRQTHVTSQYEATYGNLLRVDDYGDTAVSGDEMTTVTSYPPNASAWIVGLPASVATYSGAGVSSPPTSSRIREVDYYYDSASSCAIASGNTTPTVGNLTRTVSVDGSSTPPESRRAFDAYGNAVCSRDANGNVTQFAYDSTLQTFLTATATPPTPNAPAGMTTSTTYYGIGGVPWSSSSADPGYYGLPQSTTTPNTTGPSGPDTTKFVYDVFGRTSSRTDPDGFVTSWGYSSLGTVGTQNVSESSPNGTAQSYFDGLGRSIKTRHQVSGTGRWIDTVESYLATSAVYQSSASYFESGGTALNTTYAYDVHGRPLSVTSPDGAVVSSCYDDLAGVTGATDPKGHRKRQTQDVRGRIIRTDEYTGSVGSCLTTQDAPYATTTYTHDLLGHVVAATNAVQSPITWDYDMLGRKIAASDPDLGNWSYSYDGVGNLIYQQDANGKGTFLRYDTLNRVVLKHYCSGTSLAACASEPSNSSDVAYTYDDAAVSYAKGRLTKMIDSSGVTAQADRCFPGPSWSKCLRGSPSAAKPSPSRSRILAKRRR